jgi:RNA polymerase sigma-70 factor (ECF subfamily)
MNPDSADLEDWFVTELEPHRPAVRAWLLARFPTLADVDNLVQEALMRVCNARATAPIHSPRALLFTAARNLALDTVRRQQVVPMEPLTDDVTSFVVAEGADVVASVSKQEELEVLTNAIQSLPERCRQVLTLRTAYGMTQKQIAARLGVSESTVEKAMAQAIRSCAQFFAGGGAR